MDKSFLVSFNFPFRIALKNSDIAIRWRNNNILVRWFKRNGVISKHRNVFFSRNNSSWVKDNISDGIQVDQPIQQKFWIAEKNNSGDSSVVGFIEDGLHGGTAFHYYYTEFLFYVQYLNGVISKNNEIISDAIDFANYFINVYRDVTSDINVSTILKPDLEYIKLFEVINEDFDVFNQGKAGGIVQLRPLIVDLSWATLKSIKPFVTDFNDENLEGIKDRIVHNYITPLWFEILLDAKEQCYKYKNYDLSVVLLETSFEAFLDFTLIRQLRLAKVPDEEITRKLECPFLSKLKELVPKYAKKRIDESVREYVNWNNLLYKIRIKIVHQGFKGCMEADANRAFNALMRLITYIDDYSTIRGFN